MSQSTLPPSLRPKGARFMERVATVYNKRNYDEEQYQRLGESAEFIAGLGELMDRCSAGNQFVSEERPSSYGYLSGYQKPISVEGQIDILRGLWPNLNPDRAIAYAREEYPKLELPDWVEGPAVIIRPGFFSDKYGEELQVILDALKQARNGKFVNYRENCLVPQYLRQSARTVERLQLLRERQPESDLLIVPWQFGIRHRGRSVRRVRELFLGGEYGHGAKDVGTMLLTHPNRLQHYDDLWIDCAGDEYSGGGDGHFSYSPCFGFSDAGLGFDADYVGNAGERCGSVSGVVSPQE